MKNILADKMFSVEKYYSRFILNYHFYSHFYFNHSYKETYWLFNIEFSLSKSL